MTYFIAIPEIVTYHFIVQWSARYFCLMLCNIIKRLDTTIGIRYSIFSNTVCCWIIICVLLYLLSAYVCKLNIRLVGPKYNICHTNWQQISWNTVYYATPQRKREISDMEPSRAICNLEGLYFNFADSILSYIHLYPTFRKVNTYMSPLWQVFWPWHSSCHM